MSRSETPMKLSAALPKNDASNGLGTIHAQMAEHGHGYFIASVVSPEVMHRIGDVRQPVLVIGQIEGLPTGPLAKAAKQLMDWARAEREGDDDGALISREELLATIRGTAGDPHTGD